MARAREQLAADRARRQMIKDQQALQRAQKDQSNQKQPSPTRHTIAYRGSRRASPQPQQMSRQSPPAPSPAPTVAPDATAASTADASTSTGSGPATARRSYDLPVTKATLSELDVTKIIHNPKLRHDINYDPELHFRPNVDGEKGRRKQQKSQAFWDTLRDDLTLFATNRDEFMKIHSEMDEWSLPALLGAVKDIIQTLVPVRDREVLNEGLNVPLLMQQFTRGVLDLEKLALWLSSVLKMHCAPMRDEWVDEMYNELSRGNRDNDIGEVVKGLSSLLSVLEAMKLDVANHQIRCLRPLLIEDTIHFEQRFFCKKIQNSRMSIEGAVQWYKKAVEQTRRDARFRRDFGETFAFFSGLVKLLKPSVDASQVPNTFLFDEDRILKLRADMFDAIHIEICMRVYERALTQSPEAMASDEEFDFNTPPQSATSSRPSSSIGDDESLSRQNQNQSSFLNNVMLSAHDPEDFAEARQRTQNLYQRLVILLQSVPATARPAQRWEDLWTNMAVEISNALGDVDRADQIEQYLKRCVDPSHAMKIEVEDWFERRMHTALGARVRDFKSMPSVSLFVLAAGGRVHPNPNHTGRAHESNTAMTAASAAAAGAAATAAYLANHRETRVLDAREDGCVEDMALRLSHLGLLHWRVWCNIAYNSLVDPPEPFQMPFL